MGIIKPGIRTACFRLVILLTTLCLFPIKSYPVAAIGVSDYFTFSYKIELSKTNIVGTETLYATVTGQATCVSDLPAAPSEAVITGRIIAENLATGVKVTLNPGYTVSLNNFPIHKGESMSQSQTAALQFPPGSQNGNYRLVGEVVEAKVKILTWWDVKPFLPASQAAGTVSYATDTAGTVNLSGLLNDAGILTQTVNIGSADEKCKLTLENGTRGTIQGVIDKPVATISITEMKQPPSLPDKTNMIGLAYDLQPDGSVFNPPLTLVFSYSDTPPSQIPEGVDEKNLVLAYWDKITGKWVELDCTVNPGANTITAKISHFCTFAAVAHTQPAKFTAGQLSVVLAETHTGEKLNVSITLANEGDISGSYEVTLKIDDFSVAGSQTVTLAGHSKEEITFSTSINTPGTHTLNIAGVSGTVVVKAPANFSITELLISPPDVNINDKVNIGVLVTNNGEVTDSYQVNLKVDGQDAGNQKVMR